MNAVEPAPYPPNETARLLALRRYEILDTAPERAFDDIVDLAAAACGTPIALLTLVDEQRQWFKARHGTDVRETPRDVSFCAHAILQPGLFVVEDARRDPRFHDNPAVEKEGIAFYAGMPLITAEGAALGTLCVVDRVPRKLLPHQVAALKALARLALTLLDMRRNAVELAEALRQRGFDAPPVRRVARRETT